jgi:hypothetical protein
MLRLPCEIGLRRIFGYHSLHHSVSAPCERESAGERRNFMAKGKTNNSAKSQSAARSRQKATLSEDVRSPAPAKKAAASAERAVSSEEIGHCAGEIWGLLHSHGDQTLAAIKKSIDAPADLTVAAIGWLAREGKLDFSADGRAVKISLR